MARKTVTIKAQSTLAGIVKKGESYSKQTYSNTAQVLIGKEGTSVGRGYFSYDLSQIPKNAKIANVILKMTSWYNVDNSKYGADFVIAPSFQNIVSEYEWDFLKIPGYPSQILKMNIGQTLLYTVPMKHWLETGIQGNFGGKFNLMVNHLYEETKFLKIGGSTDALELIVTYDFDDNSEGGGGENPSGKLYFKITECKIDNKEQSVNMKYITNVSINDRQWRTLGCYYINDNRTSNGGEGTFSLKNNQRYAPNYGILGIVTATGGNYMPSENRFFSIPSKITPNRTSIAPGETITYTCEKLYKDTNNLRWEGSSDLDLISTSEDGLSATFLHNGKKTSQDTVTASLTYYAWSSGEGDQSKGDVTIVDNSVTQSEGSLTYPKTAKDGSEVTVTIPNYTLLKKNMPDLRIETQQPVSTRPGGKLRVQTIDYDKGLIKVLCIGVMGGTVKGRLVVRLISDAKKSKIEYENVSIDVTEAIYDSITQSEDSLIYPKKAKGESEVTITIPNYALLKKDMPDLRIETKRRTTSSSPVALGVQTLDSNKGLIKVLCPRVTARGLKADLVVSLISDANKHKILYENVSIDVTEAIYDSVTQSEDSLIYPKTAKDGSEVTITIPNYALLKKDMPDLRIPLSEGTESAISSRSGKLRVQTIDSNKGLIKVLCIGGMVGTAKVGLGVSLISDAKKSKIEYEDVSIDVMPVV